MILKKQYLDISRRCDTWSPIWHVRHSSLLLIFIREGHLILKHLIGTRGSCNRINLMQTNSMSNQSLVNRHIVKIQHHHSCTTPTESNKPILTINSLRKAECCSQCQQPQSTKLIFPEPRVSFNCNSPSLSQDLLVECSLELLTTNSQRLSSFCCMFNSTWSWQKE